ncbi:MAG: MerR family transcriptional regulator [Bulleidia sp.]
MQTKDIVSLLGVTNNLLRYYEEKGVIQPLRRSNGYRNYQRNDVVALLEGMRYSRLGFQVKQIPDFVNGTQQEQVQQLREKLAQRQQELVFRQLENQALEKRTCELEKLPDYLNHFHFEQIPEKILLPYRSWSKDTSFM